MTSERVAFRGANNHDWLYGQPEDVTVETVGAILITVSSRRTRSGLTSTVKRPPSNAASCSSCARSMLAPVTAPDAEHQTP